MAYDVTSRFLTTIDDPFAQIGRRFTIAGSDYSSYVTKWPTFKRSWNDIRPKALTISLANEDQTFNFFRSDRTNLTSEAKVELGIDESVNLLTESGEYLVTEAGENIAAEYSEFITVFQGDMEKVAYRDALCRVTVNDKFKQIGDLLIGDSDNPVDYTGSDHLMSDLAWYICTSHAGYSAIESTSNPDIDFGSFQAWANVFSSDNVVGQAYFDGQNANQGLRKIGRITQSAIFIKDNKISFHRFSLADSNQSDFDASNIKSLSVELNDRDIVNRQIVFGGYNVSSDAYSINVLDASTSSVNSFGAREQLEKDDVVWYVDSVSCINLAQRSTLIKDNPYDRLSIDTAMPGLPRQVGETITAVDSLMGIDDTYRIMGMEIDTDKGKIKFEAEKSQVLGAFILDVSDLDGTDVLI